MPAGVASVEIPSRRWPGGPCQGRQGAGMLAQSGWAPYTLCGPLPLPPCHATADWLIADRIRFSCFRLLVGDRFGKTYSPKQFLRLKLQELSCSGGLCSDSRVLAVTWTAIRTFVWRSVRSFLEQTRLEAVAPVVFSRCADTISPGGVKQKAQKGVFNVQKRNCVVKGEDWHICWGCHRRACVTKWVCSGIDNWNITKKY